MRSAGIIVRTAKDTKKMIILIIDLGMPDGVGKVPTSVRLIADGVSPKNPPKRQTNGLLWLSNGSEHGLAR